MTRVRRSDLPDGVFHVYSRAVAGAQIFLDDLDRGRFLTLLELCRARHDWRCHAFALLSTHYHLVLEATRRNLSAGIHRLNGRYAQDFTKRHDRFGHVFSERFQARAIESEQYLYDACAYVAQNPVRAGLCERAEDWPWSYSRYGF